MGKARIGSDLINIWGNRTTDRGLATTGYDDDGVKATKFPIIEKGIFKHYQTIRDQAHLIGEKEPAPAAMPTIGPACPSSACPTSGSNPANARPLSTT